MLIAFIFRNKKYSLNAIKRDFQIFKQEYLQYLLAIFISRGQKRLIHTY